MLDLSLEYLHSVRRIISEHVPSAEVRAFGSRVNGGAKKYSDIDLVVIEAEKLSFDRLCLLIEAFQNSELPIRVDLVDWHRITPSFQKVIDAGYLTIWPS